MNCIPLAESPVEIKTVAVLIQLLVIILVARLFARLARVVGQPAVVGEILAGLILGPSLFGKLPFIHDYWMKLFHPEIGTPLLSSLPECFTVLSQLGLIFRV